MKYAPWIFRILTNRAKTRGAREARLVAFSSLDDDPPTGGETAWFSLAGSWAQPQRWEPERRLTDDGKERSSPWSLAVKQLCRIGIDLGIFPLPRVVRFELRLLLGREPDKDRSELWAADGRQPSSPARLARVAP